MKITLLLVSLLFAASLRAAGDKPNVILIMADDFGYECVTANGGQSYQTPVLDKLAAQGIRFEHCHAQPLCTPTRVQLMTGRYNVRNYINFGTLPTTETTFGHLLKKAGYATGICGKWQLGAGKELPQHFGFDESYLWQHTRRPARYANPGIEHNGEVLDFSNGEYGPTLVNDFALDFVTRHREKPFFLYYPMILTHNPFQPTPDSPEWDPATKGENAKQNNKHFADMTVYMDKMIGRLVSKLEELGLRENTLLLFLGDNGTNTKITSQFKGVEYPGGKGSTRRNGTHVPLIVSWPAKIKTGRVNSDLISTADFLPTLCEAAGVAVPEKVDGVSFLPQLKGEAGSPREWLYCWYSPRQRQDLSVLEYAFDRQFKLYRDGRFYDLGADPMEKDVLGTDALAGDAATAAKKLGNVLEKFSQARPVELDKAFRQEAKSAPSKGNKKKGKK
ncbi:arylsulfatase A [Prosthecobacter fusiformis]|uniref:Arylsulfatase A n=1 Tax=Prosthecobacter fusiformis TaxID=48464 RepID=A0A4R7RUF5_9BACT|nr:sulfatase-like hydrolase/transferase [Prosthecobacter fusiformis]TDU69372.1 arylsulfatase A [Prosthecobacter fusiformis]